MGVEGEVGTVQVGRRADLLIVDGDPTRSIAEIRAVSTVVAGGRMYRTDQLRAVLEASR
jgi:imidazolonepropionase-like amidohydrolase